MCVENLEKLEMAMGTHEAGACPRPPSPFKILPPVSIPIPVTGSRSPFPVPREDSDPHGYLWISIKKNKKI